MNLTSPIPIAEIEPSSWKEKMGMSSVDLRFVKSFLSGDIETFAPVSIIQDSVAECACRATAMLAKLGFGLGACRF